MSTVKYEITFKDGLSEHVSYLTSAWDGLVCKESEFSELPESLKTLEELVVYSVLESPIKQGTIYMTKYGPQWADVFEGDDAEIEKTIEIIVKRQS